MLLFLLAYLGGVLTIFSPCVLPVLPFVFVRANQPFRRSGLPTLMGMALTFTVLASLATLGGAWLVQVNQYGRYVALLFLLVLGLTLWMPKLAQRLMAPLVALGARLQQRADAKNSVGSACLLGVALGFLWAPCAGPILGLILATAALQGANWHSALLLLVFAAGAVTALGLALLAGTRVFAWMKRQLGIEEWVRRVLGVVVVFAVVAIALGWDTRFLARFSFLNLAATEQKLLERLASPASGNVAHQPGGMLPSIAGATHWLNSPPLSNEQLRGKVVLVDFWTYSCINCLRTLPYLKAWDQKYRALGLVIVGVHAPEFAFEKDLSNVRQAVRDLGVSYPVAMDNQFTIWNAFANRYWPAHYLADAQGRVRHTHKGEGAYAETESLIRTLLKEANPSLVLGDEARPALESDASLAASQGARSPETYVGYARQDNFASLQGVQKDAPALYSLPPALERNEWALGGHWQVAAQAATTQVSGAVIRFAFAGRDVNLVLGSPEGKPVRFRVKIDGQALSSGQAGGDVNAQGHGTITQQRLYQLIRLKQPGTHTFEIEFLDPGAQAFAFTFG